ncbi:MAG: dynamin family protein [Selenomonadaceae bacterium]|nr:dynamin family protein [Selenomonadaceae bacterium]
MQAANKKILKKLESREFTVAIVGLEKAGKSTLGNALINLMVLPEYTERCTYTTTEIRAGDTNIAEVYFYGIDEFNKNFQRMLSEIEYPDAVNFSSMTLDAFEKYWRDVENDSDKKLLFQSHDQTTARDIKEMLSGKSKITPLLGHEIMTFDEKFFNADDKFNQFKQYVTGLAGENPDGSVIRQPYPYAVKNIIIHSTKLANMKNMVIYDVPGFDSPTELHKRQTEEMLKESDAIILVTNAGDRPNLTGTQLDMLRKGQDDDGIKLSVKAFVFGNKIDTALDMPTAKRNFIALRNDSIQNQIALYEHIFSGSARAYLERIGLLTGEHSKKRIEEWQLPNGDGIENLRQNMQQYYDNNRFEVLKRRAENNLDKTKIVLKNLYDRYSSGDLSDSDISAEIFMEMQSRLGHFMEESRVITNEFKRNINAERPFTTALKNDVDNIYPLVEDEYLPLIEKAENNATIDVDGVYPTTKVDSDVRNMLESIFVENIVKSASRFTNEKQKELRQALVDSFLKVMGLESSTTYNSELEDSVNKLFDQMLIEGGATCNFNSLVERFVTTIIQTLITHPFAVHERYNKVTEALDELVALSVYYNMPKDAAEKKNLQLAKLIEGGTKFFARILAHEGVSVKAKAKPNVNATDNEIFLRQIFEIKENIIGIAISYLPIADWAKLILQAGINLKQSGSDELRNNLENLFYKRRWAHFSNEQKIQAIKMVIDQFITQNGVSQILNVDDNRDFSPSTPVKSDSLVAQIDEMQKHAKEAKQMQGKDDMIKILDTDILLLRDITAKAVINAIGLERAFNSVIIKNVDLIRRHLNAPKGNEIFRTWIRAYAKKVMPSRFGTIEAERAIRESRKDIFNVVKKVLNNWN